jgi:hypothetical protein
VPIEDTIFGLEWFILLSGYMMVSLRDEPMPFDKDPLKEAPVSHAHAITGGRGHILNGPIVPCGLAFDAHFDEDWEIGKVWR